MTGPRNARPPSRPRKFARYPQLKDSGVDWLGQLPAHWDVRRLKAISTVQLSNVDKKSVEGEVAVRLCNYVDVYYNDRVTDDLNFMVASATPEQVRRFTLRAGDVLITKDSESWSDIAVPALVVNDLPGVLCGYHLAHIRPSNGCYGPFLSRAFAAIGPRDQFRIAANGVTRFGLGNDAIRTALFAIPSEAEQRAIAAFIDEGTGKIDALVASKKRLIHLLEEERRALITLAVTKGLNPNAALTNSGVEWLGMVPAHWTALALKRVSSIKYGLGQPPQQLRDGLPFIRATNVTKGRIVERDMLFVDPADVPKGRAPVLRTGDIVVVRSGAYTGDSAIVPPKYNGAIAGYDMVVRPQRATPAFLAWALLSRYVLEAQIELESLRAAQPHLNAEELGSIRLLLPPESEQRLIASFLDRETTRIDDLVAKVGDAVTRLVELRTALISAAVTGKIDVRGTA